jgi:transcription initiation factor TFIIH subunit 4
MVNEQRLEEILSLVFALSACVCGRPYPMDAVTPLQQQVIFELSHLGLVYVANRRFYPSRLATSLLNAAPVQGSAVTPKKLSSELHMSIIVETNFQVMAYVVSDLYLAILRIFVDVGVRLPNAVLGQITRARSREAFSRGITSEQIIRFLETHAHSKVHGRGAIPTNVREQLLLWEKAADRISMSNAVLVDFGDTGHSDKTRFASLCKTAKEQGVCLWVDEKRLRIAIAAEGYDALKTSMSEALIS